MAAGSPVRGCRSDHVEPSHVQVLLLFGGPEPQQDDERDDGPVGRIGDQVTDSSARA